ncbi:MAG: methionyl-tRNA formyltransferase [Lachnospiraceae bacterium]|nr:methionyl-tRNA formyltransferase [Lachnospiraceae bacterium]
MNIVYMGTPDFAVPALEALIREKYNILAVVTQPDKPKGRGKNMQFPPVKETALKYDIPVYQPVKVRNPEFIEVLTKLQPDVIVVAAFGQILPKEILELPKYGCVNIHASLLPRLRGAAPIQWAILDGDKECGVTIMQMNEGLDTGDILTMQKMTLTGEETGGSLFDALSGMGGELLLETLPKLQKGEITPIKQNDDEATYARMLNKTIGKLDFSQPAEKLERYIRGLNPWPSAYTTLDGKTLKIWKAKVSDTHTEGMQGAVASVSKDAFSIGTGDKDLIILELQLEGKKRMDVAAFLRGYPLEAGHRFDSLES